MTRGTYTRDFYILPTIIYHNGDGYYKTIEFAWLKFYFGVCWCPKKGGEEK